MVEIAGYRIEVYKDEETDAMDNFSVVVNEEEVLGLSKDASFNQFVGSLPPTGNLDIDLLGEKIKWSETPWKIRDAVRQRFSEDVISVSKASKYIDKMIRDEVKYLDMLEDEKNLKGEKPEQWDEKVDISAGKKEVLEDITNWLDSSFKMNESVSVSEIKSKINEKSMYSLIADELKNDLLREYDKDN